MSYQQIFHSLNPALAAPRSKARNITAASPYPTQLAQPWARPEAACFHAHLPFSLCPPLFKTSSNVSATPQCQAPSTVLPSSFPYKVLQKQSRERLRVTASSQRERRHQRKNQSMPLADSLSSLPKSTSSRWTPQKHRSQIRCQALRPSKNLVGGQEGRGKKTLPSQRTRQSLIQKTMTNKFPLSNGIFVISYKTFVVDWQIFYFVPVKFGVIKGPP